MQLLEFDSSFIQVLNIKKKLSHSETIGIRYTTLKTLELIAYHYMVALPESCTMMHHEISTRSSLGLSYPSDSSRGQPDREGGEGGFRSLRNVQPIPQPQLNRNIPATLDQPCIFERKKHASHLVGALLPSMHEHLRMQRCKKYHKIEGYFQSQCFKFAFCVEHPAVVHR